MTGRKLNNQIALDGRRHARGYDQTSINRTRECRDGAFGLASVAQVEWAHLYADRPRHGLNNGELADPGHGGGIPKD